MTDAAPGTRTTVTDALDGVGTSELLTVVGAEIAELQERLVRRQSGMTLAQFRVLELAAASHPDRLEPWQLGEHLGIGSNHLSTILDQLEASGRVRRHAHPTDGRRRLIEVTGTGRDDARRVGDLSAALQARLVDDGLDTADLNELRRLLGAVHARVVVVAEQLRRRPGP
jgi:DNA-binding MarR family transcriptional regulator